MLRGIFALFFRSLRSESRSFWIHFSRFFLLLMFYFGLAIAQEQAETRGAPGLDLFQYAIYANATFLTLLGLSYFSSVISEEREEDTLGLISMTGVSSLALLLGKSTTRLFQVLLFLAVQYPFTLLAITLGGLVPEQIFGAYVALAAYTILIANIGLFCSVICRRSRDAASLTLLCVICYASIPLFATMTSHAIQNRLSEGQPYWNWGVSLLNTVLEWAARTNIFGELGNVTTSSYQFHLSPQMTSNVLGGALLFVLSWWLFGIISHDEIAEQPAATSRTASALRFPSLRAGRCWKWAIVWKDFHFVAGGRWGIFTRIALYVGLFVIGVLLKLQLIAGESSSLIFMDVLNTYRLFVVPIFLIDCALSLSRPFQEEIQQQTLSSILMLPISVWHVMHAKLLGCLLGLVPGMIAVLIAFIIPVDGFSIRDIISSYAFWWAALHILLALHLCVVLSSFLRTAVIVTAVAITIGIMVPPILYAEWSGLHTMNLTIYLIQFGGLVLLMMGCQTILVSRLKQLGSR